MGLIPAALLLAIGVWLDEVVRGWRWSRDDAVRRELAAEAGLGSGAADELPASEVAVSEVAASEELGSDEPGSDEVTLGPVAGEATTSVPAASDATPHDAPAPGSATSARPSADSSVPD